MRRRIADWEPEAAPGKPLAAELVSVSIDPALSGAEHGTDLARSEHALRGRCRRRHGDSSSSRSISRGPAQDSPPEKPGRSAGARRGSQDRRESPRCHSGSPAVLSAVVRSCFCPTGWLQASAFTGSTKTFASIYNCFNDPWICASFFPGRAQAGSHYVFTVILSFLC